MLSSVCTRRSSASRAPISEAPRASVAPLVEPAAAADVTFWVSSVRRWVRNSSECSSVSWSDELPGRTRATALRTTTRSVV